MISEVDKEELKLFGDYIKKIRLSKNLTLRKMALLCNLEHADIQRYEAGKTNVTLLSILELAKAFDIPPAELLRYK